MKGCGRTLAVVAVVLTSIAPVAAQEGMRQPGPGGGLGPYDASSERTVSGSILRTYIIPGATAEMMIAEITTSAGSLHLILGPSVEVQKLKFAFTKNLRVTVTGVGDRQVNGEPAMLVRKIVASGATLTLRDEHGTPVWAKGPSR